MKWTTETPTEPGWYWVEMRGEALSGLEIVKVEFGFDYPEMRVIGSDEIHKQYDFDISRWAGPIPEPGEDPKPPMVTRHAHLALKHARERADARDGALGVEDIMAGIEAHGVDD